MEAYAMIAAVDMNMYCDNLLNFAATYKNKYSVFSQQVYFSNNLGFFFWLVKNVCQATFAAVVTVKVRGHEDACPTFLVRTLSAQSCDLAILIHLHEIHTQEWLYRAILN